MQNVIRMSRDAVRLAWTYLSISRKSRAAASLFDNVHAYCMFVGYPRSGHSIIGALLDAHPHAVIAHELGALQYIHAGYDRQRLFYLLLRNTQAVATSQSRSPRYMYDVPGQWQGRAERVRVIGDKQDGGATLRLQARPWLLNCLRRRVKVPIRVIHVVRNPYDNITTVAIRAANGGPPDVRAASDQYFDLCRAAATILQRSEIDEVAEVRHERFIAQPEAVLRELCHTLDLSPSPKYLEDCARIVYASPHKSRHKATWTQDLRDSVQQSIQRFPFLAGYTFEDSPTIPNPDAA